MRRVQTHWCPQSQRVVAGLCPLCRDPQSPWTGMILGGKLFYPFYILLEKTNKHRENLPDFCSQGHGPIIWNLLHLLHKPPHCPRPGCPPALMSGWISKQCTVIHLCPGLFFSTGSLTHSGQQFSQLFLR